MKYSERIQSSIDWWKGHPHGYNPAFSMALDHVYGWSKTGILPVTITSNDVSFIWVTPKGDCYGLTNAQAQSIRIVYEKYGYIMPVGELFCIDKDLPEDMQYYALSL